MKNPGDYNVPPLKEGELHLWSFQVSSYIPYADKRLDWLSSEEKEKADRFYHERDRNRSRVAYVLLREILCLYTGVEPASISLLKRESGKPYMTGKNTPFFNMSHSGDRILYGFSSTGEAGVDIELIKDVRDLDGLIDTCCSPGEIEELGKAAEADRAELFYRYWSSKEAYLKGIGTGITIPLKSVDCSREERIGTWSVIPCSVWPGYSASAALEYDNPRILLITGEDSL